MNNSCPIIGKMVFESIGCDKAIIFGAASKENRGAMNVSERLEGEHNIEWNAGHMASFFGSTSITIVWQLTKMALKVNLNIVSSVTAFGRDWAAVERSRAQTRNRGYVKNGMQNLAWNFLTSIIWCSSWGFPRVPALVTPIRIGLNENIKLFRV